MYNVAKSVIEMGGYNLTDILGKIDKLWLKGSISDSEREDLYTMAQTNARVKDSIDIVAKITELEAKINALEAEIEGAGEDTSGSDTVPDEFVVGKWYYAGNKITYNGEAYECIAPEGVACVWSPDDYPAYWKEN